MTISSKASGHSLSRQTPIAQSFSDAADDLGAVADHTAQTVRHGVDSLRQAVSEDLRHGGEWLERKTHHARVAIQDEPQRATLYALGVGVLIGLLMRR